MSKEYIEKKFSEFYERGVSDCENGRKLMKEMLAEERAKGHTDRITEEEVDRMQDGLLSNLKRWYTIHSEGQQMIIESVCSLDNDDLYTSFRSVMSDDDISTDEDRFATSVIVLEFESRLLDIGFLTSGT